MLCNLRLTSHCSLVYLYSLFKSCISSLFFRKTQTFSCKSNANPCGELLIPFLNNSSLFLPKTSKLLSTIMACWWEWNDVKINSSRILFGVGELHLTEIYGIQIILVSLFLVKKLFCFRRKCFYVCFQFKGFDFLEFYTMSDFDLKLINIGFKRHENVLHMLFPAWQRPNGMVEHNLL